MFLQPWKTPLIGKNFLVPSIFLYCQFVEPVVYAIETIILFPYCGERGSIKPSESSSHQHSPPLLAETLSSRTFTPSLVI
ncbi:hypothetical protein GDO78_014021 [Eleutherodactylus coqui]|uniref:Uncharacterized protein n=1 Tax=Eleutherodactylus coqui TaxID=57060 RepID=A0A8J6ELV6_ELECQ|nr:hypothetical protein GDO78_014021 [Eleutherodactylus coqui]